jgi:dienelactone hydrolase
MKRMHHVTAAVFILFFGFCICGNAVADSDADGDFTTRIKGVSETLVMKRFGSDTPSVMIVWIHGDVSAGGPANYHFKVADKVASKFSSDKVLCVALVRPGYSDGEGGTSTGNNYNRSDSYTKDNINEVGTAIERLRTHYKPARVIVVGHSGGAAYTAVLAGMKPKLAEAFVLVSCPADLVAWRNGRRAWNRSENPITWVDKVSKTVKVVALTGSKDDNTFPDLAKSYVEALKSRGVDANFVLVPGENHNGAFTSNEVMNTVQSLLK